MITYEIYQTKADYAFFDYKFTKEHGFSLNDYKKVYTGTIKQEHKEINEVLEYIYIMLNANHPIGYNARSLSVSDLIKIDDEYYYCDSVGFTKLN